MHGDSDGGEIAHQAVCEWSIPPVILLNQVCADQKTRPVEAMCAVNTFKKERERESGGGENLTFICEV